MLSTSARLKSPLLAALETCIFLMLREMSHCPCSGPLHVLCRRPELSSPDLPVGALPTSPPPISQLPGALSRCQYWPVCHPHRPPLSPRPLAPPDMDLFVPLFVARPFLPASRGTQVLRRRRVPAVSVSVSLVHSESLTPRTPSTHVFECMTGLSVSPKTP